MYPLFVGGIVLCVTFFLMIYLVPQMVGFIRNMGQEIPLQTRILIAVSNFFVELLVGVIAAPFVVWFGLKFAAQTNPVLRYRLDDYKLRLPVIGPILRKIILSRFASSFAMMYCSGITVLDAIRSSEEIVGNRRIEEALRTAGQQIARGQERHRGVPGRRAVPAAGDPHAAHRRGHRRARHRAAQRELLLQPRGARGHRQGAGHDRADADGGAGRDPRLGDAVGARAGLRHDLAR